MEDWSMIQGVRFVVLPLAVLAVSGGTSGQGDQPAAGKPVNRSIREVEGWKVHVDSRLLDGPQAEIGAKALRILAFKLYEIKLIVPAKSLARLQGVVIVLDLSDPRLKAMQYHPSAAWLKANGHDPALAKTVHLPQAAELASRLPINQQPMVILHELAHAYHDQVLGFDEPRIQQAWARFKESGKFDEVLHIRGTPRRHYALTDHKEFFAEMTEAYFGTNDFYPFVRSELRKELPDVHKLLEAIWGPAP
jgi:hypothetical protein